MIRIQRALISVTDKTGVADFARGLDAMGVEVLSTGGTARAMTEAGVKVVEVADFTGFPEMLDGRVKTLHPKVHAGILFRRDLAAHVSQMAAHHLQPIDLVCVNLYAFEATVARPGVTLDEAIENIDIGGPTLLRAAAKNYASVTVVIDPADYGTVLAEMRAHQHATTLETRFALARKVFQATSAYDAAITAYLRGIEKPA
jgi:phosphoribosylaminoimidazolecarboxamide formyltransferase/IMP cyclohydrolase